MRISMYKTLTGYLREVTNGQYFMELQDGSFVEVDIHKAKVPINRLIALSVLDQPNVDQAFDVTDKVPAYSIVSQPLGDPIPEKKHIGIFRIIPLDATDDQEAQQLIKAQEAARQVEVYTRTYARHIWDIQVRGFVFRGENVNVNPPEFGKTAIDAFIAGHDMDGFEPNYWHVWGGSSSSWCGLAFAGGYRSVTFTNRGDNCGVRTIIHEAIGHNMGLGHAGLVKPDGTETEYFDSSSIMGGGSELIRGMHSPHYVRLGLDTDREIKIVDHSMLVWIAPIELPVQGMHDQESQHVIIKVPQNEDIFLSTRKTRGWPYPQPKSDEGLVFIHRVKFGTSKLLQPKMREGESRLLENGIRIDYVLNINESSLVSITFPGDDLPVPQPPPPIGFPTNIPSACLGPEHNGAWYDPDFNGQGLDVQIRNGTLVVYWYTFNENNDSRRFYFGSCPIGDIIEEFELFTTEGGTFDDPARRVETSVGTAQLYFVDGAHGVFNFNTKQHGRGSIEIQPAALSSSSNSGVYYQADKVGSGFSIQFFELRGVSRCVAYWYTYGPKPPRPPFGTKEIHDQRWYSCEGLLQDDGSYSLTIYELTGGRFLRLDRPEFINVGESRLIAGDDGRIDFSYLIDGDLVGSYLLERVF